MFRSTSTCSLTISSPGFTFPSKAGSCMPLTGNQTTLNPLAETRPASPPKTFARKPVPRLSSLLAKLASPIAQTPAFTASPHSQVGQDMSDIIDLVDANIAYYSTFSSSSSAPLSPSSSIASSSPTSSSAFCLSTSPSTSWDTSFTSSLPDMSFSSSSSTPSSSPSPPSSPCAVLDEASSSASREFVSKGRLGRKARVARNYVFF
ncbi:hypothetical protein JCM8547_000257 [Rhodosporidiobolus lusitaniae]